MHQPEPVCRVALGLSVTPAGSAFACPVPDPGNVGGGSGHRLMSRMLSRAAENTPGQQPRERPAGLIPRAGNTILGSLLSPAFIAIIPVIKCIIVLILSLKALVKDNEFQFSDVLWLSNDNDKMTSSGINSRNFNSLEQQKSQLLNTTQFALLLKFANNTSDKSCY